MVLSIVRPAHSSAFLVLLGVSVLTSSRPRRFRETLQSRSWATRRPRAGSRSCAAARSRSAPAQSVRHLAGQRPDRVAGAVAHLTQSVSSLLIHRGLASLALVGASALIAIPLAVLLGSLGAMRRDRPSDHATQGIFLVLTALPEFVDRSRPPILLGTTVFTVLPPVALIPSGGAAFTHPRELALPVITLVLAVVPYLTRHQRAGDDRRPESDSCRWPG